MSITSAMYTGISGLSANGEAMGVIGNNISNVNTIGFKQGRMLFADMLSSTIGNNSQVGRGVQIQTVQNQFSQGSFENTESSTDLAIQGDSMFVVQEPGGTRNYYTRAGAFNFDKDKNLVNPDGYKVMGYGINDSTNESNGIVGPMSLTSFAALSPKMTSKISAVTNLDSTSPTLGTKTLTNISNLSFASVPVGMAAGTASTGVTISNNLDASTAVGGTASLAGVTVYDSLGFAHTTDITFTKTSATNWTWSAVLPDATSGNPVNGTLTFDGAGAFSASSPASASVTINGSTQALTFNLAGLTQNAAATNASAAQVGGVTIGGALTAFDVNNPAATSNFSGSPITLYDNQGNSHQGTTYYTRTGFNTWEANTVVPDALSGSPIKTVLAFNAAGALTSQTPGSATGNNLSFTPSLSPQPISLDFGVGISVMSASASAISSQTQDGVAWSTTSPVAASNFSTPTTIYDSQGNAHAANIYFRKSGDNAWDWHAIIPDATSGGIINGTLTFGTNGVLATQTPSNSSTQDVTFNGVTAPQKVTFDFNIGATTQFASSSLTSSLTQDGFASGALSKVSVDEKGYVNGTYSNGQQRRIAQVALSRFSSAEGLTKAGGTLFEESTESGQPLMTTASTPGVGKIISNSLEQSNVDLAAQFVKMIITQRGYSANSKTITTSDEMLQEVLNLKR